MCGYFGLAAPDSNREILGKMSHQLAIWRRIQMPGAVQGVPLAPLPHWSNSAVSAVAARTRGGQLEAYQHAGLLVLVLGDVALNGRRNQLAQRIARSWPEQGSSLCAQLSGNFLLCVMDQSRQQCLLAIDRAGIQSLHYEVLAQGLLFATSAHAVSAHPLASRSLNPQALYDYLYFHTIPSPATIYRGQQRLAPGSYLLWDRGRIRHGQYWRMQFDSRGRFDFVQQRAKFLQSLNSAVSSAAQGRATGTFLSGGTDSSTLTGLLAAQQSAAVDAYSIGFDATDYDELPYARIAAQHFALRHRTYTVTPADILSVIPRIAAGADQPFGNASLVPAYFCAALARGDGMECLLGGDGGDELFGGNARYAQQALLAQYERIPSALRQLMLEPMLYGLVGKLQLAPLRKARRYIEQASMPMPARLESYNLMHYYGLDEVLEGEFCAAIDRAAPARQLHASYWSGLSLTQIERMQMLDMRYTLAENDLRKVILACEMADIDVAFPLLSDAMLAFSAALPPTEKLRGMRLRYFFKRAVAELLPPAIVRKQKHGFGLPFGVWLMQHASLRAYVFDVLEQFKRRRIVRHQFIDLLRGSLLAQHPAYHGNMVWLLLMLELWLAQSEHAATYQF